VSHPQNVYARATISVERFGTGTDKRTNDGGLSAIISSPRITLVLTPANLERNIIATASNQPLSLKCCGKSLAVE
jgi:hypothetical protein